MSLSKMLDTSLAVRRYTLASPKVSTPFRIVFLSDLHNVYYGDGQKQLLKGIQAQKPDLILMGGDMADTRRRHYRTMVLLARLAKQYPCFYVSGNHEGDSGILPRLKRMIRALGVVVLEGECHGFFHGQQRIEICGLDDPSVGSLNHLQQRDKAKPQERQSLSVLLSHRPEMAPFYAGNQYDVIFAGHAHGGQWRLPGVFNGFFAPDQGFFPQYAGGMYAVNNSLLVVGRGLARNHVLVPRIFNPPEIVVLDVQSSC